MNWPLIIVLAYFAVTMLRGVAAKAMDHAGLLAVTDAKLAYTELIMSLHPLAARLILAYVPAPDKADKLTKKIS